ANVDHCTRAAEVVVASGAGAGGVMAVFFCGSCASVALRRPGTRLLLLRGLRPFERIRPPGA
ncbi:hypothetical protein ACFQ34_33855, partial [Pseudonocardia benzenivorans]